MNFKVDPDNITNYNRDVQELELNLIWWLLAAGKNGHTTARLLEIFMTKMNLLCPNYVSLFAKIRNAVLENNLVLAEEMRKIGFGCFNLKAKALWDLVNSDLDVNTCTVEDLENIRGIGPKTARCFLIHSRPNQKYAGLDTHILKYLRLVGYDTPKSTPSGKKYAELEKIFIDLAEKSEKSISELDLEIWKSYRKKANVIFT